MTETAANFERLVEKQNALLANINTYFSEPETEKRHARLRRLVTKTTALVGLCLSGAFGGWELASYLYEQYQIQEMSDRYAEVAGDIYYTENNPAVALTLLDKAIDLNEDDAEHYYLKSYIEGMASVRNLLNLNRPYTKEELDQAHEAVAQAAFLKRLSPKRAEPYILQGQIYAALGEYDKAKNEIDKAIQINPKSAFAHVRLALIYSSQGRIDDALREIDTAIGLEPESKWGWLWKGVIRAERQKQWDGARECYLKSLEIDPRFDLAWYNLAWTYVKNQPPDYNKAREYFNKALKINPDYKEAYYGLGMVYGYQNKYAISKIYLDKAIDLDEMFLTGYKWRGIVLTEMGNDKEALKDFSRAIKISPGNEGLYIRRAKAFQKLGEFNKAILDLQFASDISPDNKRIWLYLGDVFTKIGETAKASVFYSRGIALDPKYAEAFVGRAKVYEKMGKYERAQNDFDNAMAYASYRPERICLERGKYFSRRKKCEAAIADFRKAREIAPRLSEAWFLEAQALSDSGNKKRALDAIDHYIELKPQDEKGHVLKERLMAGLGIDSRPEMKQ